MEMKIESWKKIRESIEKGSLEKSKKIEVTDLRKLLSEKTSYLLQEMIGTYGIAYQLKKFAELDEKIILNKCTIEHGFQFKTVAQYEVSHHIPYILTSGPFREEVIKELTDIVPLAIGPYIAYAEDYRTEEYIQHMKEKNGRTLLVMPCHSTEIEHVKYDIEQFIQQIEILRRQFETVIICLYFEDIRRGMWKPYKKRGYQIVSAGIRVNPYFLSRIKHIMRLSDAVLLNNITTGIAFAMYMNLPIRIVRQQIDFDLSRCDGVYEVENGDEQERLYSLFGRKEFVITEEQREFGNYFFGLEKVKTKKEMRELLLSLSRANG